MGWPQHCLALRQATEENQQSPWRNQYSKKYIQLIMWGRQVETSQDQASKKYLTSFVVILPPVPTHFQLPWAVFHWGDYTVDTIKYCSVDQVLTTTYRLIFASTCLNQRFMLVCQKSFFMEQSIFIHDDTGIFKDVKNIQGSEVFRLLYIRPTGHRPVTEISATVSIGFIGHMQHISVPTSLFK